MNETVLCFVIACLCVAVLILLGKLHIVRRTIREIDEGLNDKLDTDTNTLVSVSGLDRYTRQLASDINRRLIRLKKEQHDYENRNDEIKTAVTNIAHDIRTPLTAINGYLELFAKAELTEQEEKWLDIIKERTDNLKELADELFSYSLAYSAKNDMLPEKLNLNDELAEVLAGFYGAFKNAGIQPKVVITEEQVFRRLDKNAFGRIISNLLSNVLKYSEGDLKVMLGADGTITFANKAPGMTQMDAERLFDRFYTVQTAKGSTGLGLSIARMLTEEMGGCIGAKLANDVLTISVRFV